MILSSGPRGLNNTPLKKPHEITICSKHVMDATRDTKTEFTIIITT